MLAVSWIVFAAAGSWLFHWALPVRPVVAVQLSAMFAIGILVAHLVGYRAYTLQGDAGLFSAGSLSPAYKPAIKSAVLQQAIVFALSALMLDFGQTVIAALATAIGYWLEVLFLLWRRPTTPTAGDIYFVKRGFLAMFFLMLFGTFLFADFLWIHRPW